MTVTGVNYEEATKLLQKSHGNVKTAIVMQKTNTNYKKAKELLKKANGFVRKAIEIYLKKHG
jgi:N-acetylmuramic acid 6-phosphate etherase